MRYFFIFLLFISSIELISQETDSLTLVDLVSRALEKDYELSNRELKLEQQQALRKQIRETFLPTLNVSSSYAYMTGNIVMDLPTFNTPILDIPLFENKLTEAYNTNYFDAKAELQLVLFTGFKVRNLDLAVQKQIEANSFFLEQAKYDLMVEVVGYYDNLAILEQVKVLLDESEELLELETEKAKKALEEDLITVYDYQKIEIASLKLEAKKVEYTGSKALLYNKLKQLTGMTTSQIDSLKIELLVFDVNTENSNIENRPEMEALDLLEEATNYKVRSLHSNYLPKIAARGSLSYYNFFNGNLGDVNFNEFGLAPNAMVGVGLSWDLFDGMKTKREVQRALIDQQMVINKKSEVQELLELNLSNSLLSYNTNKIKLELKSKELSLNKKGLEIAKRQLEVELIDLSQYLEALNDYEKSILEYQEALKDERQAALNYLKATGNMNMNYLKSNLN